MQRGDMSLPARFLSPGMFGDPPDGQVNFDEAFGGDGHKNSVSDFFSLTIFLVFQPGEFTDRNSSEA
jgi:hypothetical protein